MAIETQNIKIVMKMLEIGCDTTLNIDDATEWSWIMEYFSKQSVVYDFILGKIVRFFGFW